MKKYLEYLGHPAESAIACQFFNWLERVGLSEILRTYESRRGQYFAWQTAIIAGWVQKKTHASSSSSSRDGCVIAAVTDDWQLM